MPGYELGPALGRGGFATVYRARQLSLGRDVAVKILSTSLTTAGDRRRFDREREALGLLSGHPHIVDVHDAGLTAEAQHPFLVMRLYPGGTLAQRLEQQGRLPLGEVCTVLTKVAAALDHAHAAGVIHRDVKPANILLDQNGQPALTDFGIAGILRGDDEDGDEGFTQSTMALTYAYAAPEIIHGHRGSVTSDVYALAATAYELLTGAPAFTVRAPADLLAVLDRPPTPITAPGVPPVVSDVVLAGLAKAPAERPTSAGAFATTLVAAAKAVDRRPHVPVIADGGGDRAAPAAARPVTTDEEAPTVLRGSPSHDARDVAGTKPTHPAARNAFPAATAVGSRKAPRRTVLISAFSVAALLVVVGAFFLSTPGTPLPTHQVAFLTGHTAGVQSVAWSPDGKTLATGGDDKVVRLWDSAGRRQIGAPLTGHTNGVWSVAWSPDGKTLATGDDKTVRLWDPTTHAQIGAPLTGHTNGVWSVAWSPDGKTLATGGADGTVRLWSAS